MSGLYPQIMKPIRTKTRLKDIAELAEISVATVSMALADHPNINDDTKSRVKEIGRQLGYRPRRQPTAVFKRRLGLMIVGGKQQDAVNTPLMMQLSDAGLRHDVRLEFMATDFTLEPDEQYQRALQFAENLDGLLLVGLVTDSLLRKLHDAGVRAVVMGDVYGQFIMPAHTAVVTFDSLGMGYMATKHLLSQGHRRVAFVCEKLYEGLAHDRWCKGYRLAHQDHGVTVQPALVQVTGRLEEGAGPAVDHFKQMGQWPDAYVVPDARIAASLMTLLKQQGVSVPPRSLIYNGIAGVKASPELEGCGRIDGKIQQLAEQAILCLVDAFMGKQSTAAHIQVPFETVNMQG